MQDTKLEVVLKVFLTKDENQKFSLQLKLQIFFVVSLNVQSECPSVNPAGIKVALRSQRSSG